MQTFTRQSATGDQTQQIQDLRIQIQSLSKSIDTHQQTIAAMDNKISSMKEGEVLARGIRQSRGLLAQTVTNELKSNSTQLREHNRVVNGQ